MKLIIAEKPILARAIASAIEGTATNYGNYTVKGDYTIVAAFGHLLTLKEPEDYDVKRYGRWTLEALPIYFQNWEKKAGSGKEERLSLIGKLLENADCVIHAGDPDDEGQYLIDEILQWFEYKGPVYRLATGDTTEAALKRALANMQDNSLFVNSGWSAHARSVADIMVGYNFSRYFSLKNPQVKMLTVGRVQTPTLGLVVTRDMLIENHNKQSFYTVWSDLLIDGKTVRVLFEPAKDDPNLEEGKISDEDYAKEIAESLENQNLEAVKVSMKEIVEQPPLPFNLVKLQTYCSNKFGYDPSKTLEITQSLRDNHNAITYNRSDCQYLSEDQFREAPNTIRQVLANLQSDIAGKIFSKLPINPSIHGKAFDDKNLSAHTAIIPQSRKLDIGKLTEEERNVYLAIVKYFMAQFLPPAQKERTNLEARIEGGYLKAVSTKTTFSGYLQLIRPEKKKSNEVNGSSDIEDTDNTESPLSQIAAGSYEACCTNPTVEAKETKAPPRYTKASLNEDMTRIAKYVTDPHAKSLLLKKDKEKKGENGSIGTSATRSSIIDNLEARGFIESRGKQIRSTVLGRELYRILPNELKKPDMTGLWWAVQESIQDGEVPWTALTDSVLEMIKKVVKTRYPKVDAYHVPENMRRGKLLLGSCPRCNSDVVEGTNGYSCSGYKNGCKFVIWKRAKSGMMSKIEITPDMVHTLLSGDWIPDDRKNSSSADSTTSATLEKDNPNLPQNFSEVGNSPQRKRTKTTLKLKRLYSETKRRSYTGLVFLYDDGPTSEYGASFGLESIVNDPPKPLGKCPRCNSDVIEGKFGYGCSGYQDGCKFVIWKRAKSGMMSKTKITRGVVRKLLKSNWIPDTRDFYSDGKEDENLRAGANADTSSANAVNPNLPKNMTDEPNVTPQKLRTETVVHMKRLYSETKDKKYTGDVFLCDEGPASPYGAYFGLAAVTNDGPEILGKCPRCNSDVVESKLGYGCTGFRDGCRFSIWKNSKMKLLANVSFTKTDAKKFLAGKPVKKSKLVDKKGQKFKAELLMIEEPDNPYGPVFRVVDGTIEVKDGDSSLIKTETVPADILGDLGK